MSHARIAVYQFTPGTTLDEVLRLTRDGALPVFRQQPGFLAYEVIQAGGEVWISITRWQSRAQADAAAERIGAWVTETPAVANLIDARQHQWIGELVFSSREP